MVLMRLTLVGDDVVIILSGAFALSRQNLIDAQSA